jgi:hypothetical protein
MALMETFAVIVAVVALVWVISILFLAAPDQSAFDEPRHELHRDPSSVSAENNEVLRLVAAMHNAVRGASLPRRIKRLRQIFDEGFTGSPATADELGVEITATDAAGVAAERRQRQATLIYTRRRICHRQPGEPPHDYVGTQQNLWSCRTGH